MPKISSSSNIRSGPVAPVVLAILDGWGYSKENKHNAIQNAATPVMDALWHAYPHTLIEASGADVGLPNSQMGNSEVGHLTIGAGRIIQQELVRISNIVRAKKLSQIKTLQKLASVLRENNKTLHVIGLCSDGGVHSHINHLCGLLDWANDEKIPKISVHAFTDGRDTPAKSAQKYLKAINQKIESSEVGELTSLCGRYWAMDRDNRWERTQKAYELLTNPNLPVSDLSTDELIAQSYSNGITDEFLEPIRLKPSYIQDGDGVIMFNFRPDRARQLIKAISTPDFDLFERNDKPKANVLTFTQYEAELPVSVAFPPESLDDLLGQVVSNHGLRQFRTAETEKYPHVTYFLNGGIEKPLPGEDRHLVPSPRVATYDLSPAMSADQLTDSCTKAIESGLYSLIVINYANPDMVGHTGVMKAAQEAISKVDSCVGRILDSTGKMSGTLLVTADHGNAEVMQGADGQPWTAHTTNPVPVIIVEGEKRKVADAGNQIRLRKGGGLADIAPTILQLLSLPKPKAMTGSSLIETIETPKFSSRIPQHA
ncbi:MULTISPECIES: 2,3-bisphosphoglycerate-independent phosphoglycerate mutase [Prochlorococcus]|uniref:2,3-bisphosphoglycerate-independent phosphoglycerate mutase n=1 Tax=Prochlorococcus TaxID=1218 RepID=UPI000533915B|nr:MULTISPECIES: 2,3-bisphosphoglycerate-independent phosphoglycerate mutase [Prochlorococcus]KGG13459.1 2,3-bisphosphoglycerate-independent phosphoglycerate mutase [Prochlorococcus sp. MIT 0601]